MDNNQINQVQSGQQSDAADVAAAKTSNGLGIAAFVVSLVAVIGAWIPLLNIVSLILGLVALILGIIALATGKKRNARKGLAIAGVAIAVVTVVVFIVINVIIVNAVDDSVKASQTGTSTEQTQKSGSKSADEVAYEITYTNATLHKDSIGSVWVNAIGEITNTGSANLYLSSGSIDLEDASGSLVEPIEMVSAYPEVISPGEKGYYFESTILDDVAADSSLSVVLHPDIAKATVDKINFPVTELKLVDSKYGGLNATGRVENTGSEGESLLYVAVILYGENDTPLGVLSTIIMDEVAAGDKVGFNATGSSFPDSMTADTITRYEAVAYPMQLQF
jgi:hypothetical protein